MTYIDKAPASQTLSQQTRQKTALVPPPELSRDKHKRTRTAASKLQVTLKEREQMIATTAYLRAEKRGFAPGHEQEDWLQAEAEVDRVIIKG